MKKIILSSLCITLTLASPALALAQESTDTTPTPTAPSLTATPTLTPKQALNERKDTMKTARTTLKTNLTTARQNYKEQMEAARDAYKAKLAQFKDARKKSVVEKLDATIQRINTNRTTQMQKSIDTLTGILDRMASRAGALDPNGAAQTALTNARTKLDAASQMVASQAAKQYVFDITDETTAGQAVKASIQELDSDLKSVHESVKEAQQAVIAAIRAIHGEKKIIVTTTPVPTDSTASEGANTP